MRYINLRLTYLLTPSPLPRPSLPLPQYLKLYIGAFCRLWDYYWWVEIKLRELLHKIIRIFQSFLLRFERCFQCFISRKIFFNVVLWSRSGRHLWFIAEECSTNCLIDVRCWFMMKFASYAFWWSSGRFPNWPWPDRDFKVAISIDIEYLRNDKRYSHNYYRTSTRSHKSYIEWWHFQ